MNNQSSPLRKKLSLSRKQLNTSPKKTPNKRVSPIKNTSSISRSPKTPQTNEQVTQKVKNNRERLCNTLDTYTLLIRASHPLRCLQHNSNISVYCQTEQKLLCSNCIFNKIDHKYHVVVPVDKVHDKLERNIEVMKRQIERQVQGLEEVYRKVYASYESEQKVTDKLLERLVKSYSAAKVLMDECLKNSQRIIIKAIESTKLKHQIILSELKMLKDIYNDQLSSSSSTTRGENIIVYQHLMCATIVNQGKFYGNRWKTSVMAMAKVEKQEMGKISSLLQLLQKIILQKGPQ